MHFKLIIAFVEDTVTDKVMDAAREAGATGATVISNARGEGLEKSKTFLGLSLETQRDVVLFLVEEHLSREILETVCDVGRFEEQAGHRHRFSDRCRGRRRRASTRSMNWSN